MIPFILVLVVLFSSLPLPAQSPVLVKDVNSFRVGSPSSKPFEFLPVLGGHAFCVADDGRNGDELHRIDLKKGGSELVKDINPGSASSSITDLCVLGNRLFFNARVSGTGRELWVTDGTATGTVMVADIMPGSQGSDPFELCAMGGKLFFSCDGGGMGRELWVSDGTVKGTRMVADIAGGSTGSDPRDLTALGQVLLFKADDQVHGPELWVSDGTSTGTRLLIDFYPGATGSDPTPIPTLSPEELGGFFRVGSLVYFRATTAAAGVELCRTDGTAKGTFLERIQVTPTGSGPWGAWSFSRPWNPTWVGSSGRPTGPRPVPSW